MTSTAESAHLMQTYKRLPVSFIKGEGCWLTDTHGKQYIDALCGISVTNLGHSHPNFVEAISAQAKALAHTSNLFEIPAQETLATQLCAAGNMDRVFFGNSGAEANEAAIKLARLHAHRQGNSQPLIITFSGSFHGRTLGTLAATGNEAIKAGFEPTMPGFAHLPFNDIEASEQFFAAHTNIAAVLIEPVQGEGGIHIADPAFLKRLESLCRNHNALLMLDEIQSGNGRCGHYFAHQRMDNSEFAITPDVVTTAKGLGNGFPIGACLARGDAANVMAPGKHGSTFGGSPLACATASAVVSTVVEQNLCDRAIQLGGQIADGLKAALASNRAISSTRQLGLMLGVELDHPCADIVPIGLDKGIVLNVTAGNVVRLLPPLTLTDSEADIIAERAAAAINAFTQRN